MVVLAPGAMFSGETRAAMMYTSGPVSVNGADVVRSVSIFSGDRLRVPPQSSVTITAKGSSITVAPGSSVTFEGDAISLDPRSAVSISTTELMAARVRTMTITPAARSETKFQVVRLNGNVTIAASVGAVVISDGTEQKTVAEGSSQTVPDPEARERRRAAWVPPTVGLAGAGAAVGTAIGTTGKPASPVHP